MLDCSLLTIHIYYFLLEHPVSRKSFFVSTVSTSLAEIDSPISTHFYQTKKSPSSEKRENFGNDP